jgi:hypothetical protein
MAWFYLRIEHNQKFDATGLTITVLYYTSD